MAFKEKLIKVNVGGLLSGSSFPCLSISCRPAAGCFGGGRNAGFSGDAARPSQRR